MFPEYKRVGIKVNRFRRLKTWLPKYEVLYGLLMVRDIKLSELASKIGRSLRSVEAYMYGEREMPNEIKDIIFTEVFENKYPKEFLFNYR